MKDKLLIIGFIILLICIVGAPSERKFLIRLKQDYGEMHGNTLDIADLKSIGHSSYQSYILWSKYEYRFGTIKVDYIGIAFMTFYLGNNFKKRETMENERISYLNN